MDKINSENLKPIFSGLQKMSLIDFPGNVSMTLFTGGCNFRCSFCHNPNFVIPEKIIFKKNKEILDFLEKRKNILDAVVVCGGEPTLHGDNVIEWIKYIKSLGYKVKLDTNATRPKIIKKIIDENLVDFFAIDYKAPIEKYESVTKVPLNKEEFKEAVKMVIDSGIGYEFRTTVHSDLHSKEDITQMIKELKELGSHTYYLQAFHMPIESVGEVSEGLGTQTLVKEFDKVLEENFKNSKLRNMN